MQFCTNCGTELGQNLSFCPKCGASIMKGEKMATLQEPTNANAGHDGRSSSQSKFGVADIRQCIHPWEKSRYWLAVVTVVPITLIYIIATVGIGLLIVPIILFFAWVSVQIARAHLLGSCAEVSPDNFPEVHELLKQICRGLNYPKKVEAYVFQDGDVNAFLIRYFRTRIIMLPHELLVDMLDEPKSTQLVWILSRAVGHLKAKHLRLNWLNILIESIENLQILNMLLRPWERATQYSGDRIGLAVCRDLDAAILAMNKLMLGNELAKKTTLIGAIKQRQRISGSFFGWLAESLSTHPHLTKRIVSLINWSRSYDPVVFESFMKNQMNRDQIDYLLRFIDETHDRSVQGARDFWSWENAEKKS